MNRAIVQRAVLGAVIRLAAVGASQAQFVPATPRTETMPDEPGVRHAYSGAGSALQAGQWKAGGGLDVRF